jgi:hypothetical protein
MRPLVISLSLAAVAAALGACSTPEPATPAPAPAVVIAPQPAPVVVAPAPGTVYAAPSTVTVAPTAMLVGAGRVESITPLASAAAGGRTARRIGLRMDNGTMQYVDTPADLAIGDRVEITSDGYIKRI